MNKKILVSMLAAVIIELVPMTVFAEGALNVDQKNVLVFDDKDSGWLYAKISNTGDAPIALDEANLVLFSEEDDIILTQDYITSYPSRLAIQPGDYIYISEFLWDSALEGATIGDVRLSVQEKEEGREGTEIPCEVSFEINGTEGYDFDNYIYITLTNETAETVYSYYVLAALTDAEGNVCFVDHACFDTLGVGPNSTITYKMYIDADLVEYYEAHQITPTTAEATVFTLNE